MKNNRKCIVYLHGLGSGPNSRTPKVLKEIYPDYKIIAPELPVSPKAAYDFIIDNYFDNEDIDLIVGTSLGGFYAMAIPCARKLVVNPAMFGDEDIKNQIGLGEQPFFSERTDGAKTYIIDERFISELAEIREKIYRNVDIWYDKLDINELNNTYAAFAAEDDLLDHYEDFCRYCLPEHAYKISGGHRMDPEVIKNEIKPLIDMILEKPQKPQVFIMDDID